MLDVAVAEEDPPPKAGGRIGVVLDSAFNFYYPKLIEEAEALGEVVYLSAVRDGSLPPLDLLVVGGGFPEVLAEKLERNKSFRKAVLDYVERGGRAYAECGGFMYLTSSIVIDRSEYEMVGAIDAVTYMLERPVGKGYAWGTVVGKTPVAPVGAALRGHEFHYSKMAFREKVQPVIKLDRGVGIGGGWDGVVKKNLHAQYMHLHPYTYSVLRALCRST